MEHLWLLNPYNYAPQVAESGHLFVAWDLSMLNTRKIDPFTFGNLYFGTASGWKGLVIQEGHAQLIDGDHSTFTPLAVYPCFDYGDDWEALIDYIEQPWGGDPSLCEDKDIPQESRPVAGQEHVVIIRTHPHLNHSTGKAFAARLMEVQRDYPDVTLFLHDSESFRFMFGTDFKAASFMASTGMKTRMTLPNGKRIPVGSLNTYRQWFHLVGMSVPELSEPAKRCVFNIKSALWARDHFKEDVAFKTRSPKKEVDHDAVEYLPERTTFYHPGAAALPTDKIACDSCTLNLRCKYFRVGSVCTLPEAESSSLVRMMGTRDAETIIDGLSKLLELQASRVERGVKQEDLLGEVDPEVGKMISELFANGVKLAKVLDPSLQSPKVQVNVGGSGPTQIIATSTPSALLAQVMRDLESQGIPRDQITPKMIQDTLALMTKKDSPRVVSGELVSKVDG